MKTMLFALAALMPLSCLAAYPIEVEKQLNGAEITYSTQDIDYNMGAISLTNRGATEATCTLVFRNGPEAPRTRKASIEPGKTVNLTAKFARSIIRLRIQMTCGI
ncbi:MULTISPECIES: 3-phosphoglycerate kinase [Pseudomonas]|uniref:3-phosphoglycerate kinase n=1 Tax=Pseudomonas kuykendallii TaxID=1007099 RepID=A0A2W5CXU3_9PSED|nr:MULTISPECIES: 3-phosphoglycerate kinase [Pseudomonas]PZP23023.1 MAG: 3-phosphoglycerate kinase [Pseudomonas kuykendallii]